MIRESVLIILIVASCAFHVSEAKGQNWLSAGAGVMIRDTHDYDAANVAGPTGNLALEIGSSSKSSFRVVATVAHFSDKLNVVPPFDRSLPAAGRLGDLIPSSRMVWDPNLSGHSDLTAWSIAGEYRHYTQSMMRGPFAGIGVVWTELDALNETATPLSPSLSVGYALAIRDQFRVSVETGIQKLTSKSPRYFIPLSLSVATRF